MTVDEAPKAFICHATEDKSFVTPFAAALRGEGVDAWVDKWEILAGDSLVKKIFDEGIAQASVFIAVLSSISVTKKWVREELDAAVINRIERSTRLIPVVIEDCDIPQALRAAKRVRYDGMDLEAVLNEVTDSIFRRSDKPALGPPPEFVKRALPPIPGLDTIDTQVFSALGDLFLDPRTRSQATWGRFKKRDLLQKLEPLDLRAKQVDDSLEILAESHLISGTHTIGAKFYEVRIEHTGATAILQRRFPDLETYYQQIIAEVVNAKTNESVNDTISESLALPLVIVNYVLNDLHDHQLIKVLKDINGNFLISEVSARLRRMVGG